MPENRKLLQDLQQVFLTYLTRSAGSARVVHKTTFLHRASFLHSHEPRPAGAVGANHHHVLAITRLLDNHLGNCGFASRRQMEQVHAAGQPALRQPGNAVRSGRHDADGNGLDPTPGCIV